MRAEEPTARPILGTHWGGKWRFEAAMLGVILGFLGLELALIAIRLGGHFSYTLDDPYIHLALADRIAAGHYGLNPGEAAAPASSILFPFLLAALSFLRLGQFAPLAVNSAATCVSGILLCAILRRALPVDRLPTAALGLLGASLVLSLNLVGLALTGLEHALHVAITLACLYGAIRFLESGRMAIWWWLCALAEPLIRYEGASLWIGIVGLMLLHRRIWPALALLVGGATPLIGFSLWLRHLGLPLLPSSVLVKSGIAAAGVQVSAADFAAKLADALGRVAQSDTALRALVLCGLLVVLVLARGPQKPDSAAAAGDARPRSARDLAALALFVSAGQFALGQFGWLSRYEIYAIAFDAAVLIYGFGPWLTPLLRRATLARILIVALVPVAFEERYCATSLQAYQASWKIYAQQYQMHRLVTGFYRQPVAVNDLGWVAYRNPAYVLDLWGLGSETARLARRQDPSGQWMASLTQQHDVGLAMIYEAWFDRLPAQWQRVGVLTFDGPALFADKDVARYATGPDRVADIKAALSAFGPTLPPSVRLEMTEPRCTEASLP